MNPDLDRLQPYPFERIRHLLADVTPASLDRISLSIGEPQHKAPEFALEAMHEARYEVGKYPLTRGSDELRQSIADWLQQRFALGHESISPATQILPVNGTREALFAIAQCVLDRSETRKTALAPNPFYQIYEGAILLAGLTPTFYNLRETNPELPDAADPVWRDVQMIYICNPANPNGSVLSMATQQQLISLAQEHNFVIVSDECYSEIYRDESNPPVGLLGAAAAMGNNTYQHCLVFHSLSKRSNLPGLRSGFVAGDADLLSRFLLYRTYHGCSMAPPTQACSIAAWRDEEHVLANRQLYNKKYEQVVPILSEVMNVETPAAGFYLWPDLQTDDEQFTRDMRQFQNIDVVPGSYLARSIEGINPGVNHSRLALVAPLEQCVEAATRIRYYYQQLR
ncbi:MAG: succinyldiaminopimelate transaminase [Gammaproteobacteria bacterium]|nr:succinyldiaminopimelate transaminase [Gammaproteobacteria bacterium]